MNLTAKLTPYSSVVGGGLKLVDENGRACFVVAIMGTTDGISKEQNDELAKRLADGFNTPQPDAAPADSRMLTSRDQDEIAVIIHDHRMGVASDNIAHMVVEHINKKLGGK